MRRLILVLLAFNSFVSFAQQSISIKLKSEDMSNYALQQVSEMQQRLHELVIKEKLPAYQTAEFSSTYSGKQLESRGGHFETIQYAPDPKDHYYYRDTILLTPFTPDHFTAMEFIGKNSQEPVSLEVIKGIAMYYAPDDSLQEVIYYVLFDDVRNLISETQTAMIEFCLKQPNNSRQKKEADWITTGSALFDVVKKDLYASGLRDSSVCFSDPVFNDKMSVAQLRELEDFAFLKHSEDQAVPVSKKFDADDIDFITVAVNADQSDGAAQFKPIAFCPGHYLVVSGVDNLERQLFWIKQQDLFQRMSSLSVFFLKQCIYYHYLDLLDGNKNYTSDYLLQRKP